MRSSCSRTFAPAASDDSPWLKIAALLCWVASFQFVCLRANAQSAPEHAFHISAGPLTDALDRFSEQAGLQIVYDPALVRDRRAPHVAGTMTPAQALDQVLVDSDIVWHRLNDLTIVLKSRDREAPASVDYPPPANASMTSAVIVFEKYVKHEEIADRFGLISLEPVVSVLGIRKSLFETPRSASALSDDLMSAYGVDTALDLARVVPGTFTASIFGINGNVNIRGLTSDTYFRGIKRLENTQLFPSPITAMSQLVVVRGPPSPLFGPGKIGGYTDFIPKSARATTGRHLPQPVGEATLTGGSYEKRGAAAEIGGPFSWRDRGGGYYLYASAEKSDTYHDNVPFEQYILQSAFDYQLADSLRMEFGQMFQYWGGTELAGWNRITQELIDTGKYRSGDMLVDMDRDGDGLVSTAEIDSFGALLRTLPLGTPPEQVAALLGDNWRIDPSTAGFVKLSRSATAQSVEDDGKAAVNLAYLDFIFDTGGGSRLTNKMYVEDLDRYKWTRASAFGQQTRSRVFEDKLLYERPGISLTEGLSLNVGASASYRYYDTTNLTGGKYNDLVNRADISRPFSSRNRFAVPNLEPDLAPWNSGLESRYTVSGAGVLLDGSYRETTLTVGLRHDWLEVHSRVPQFVLSFPGVDAHGSDAGWSWSASLSHEVATGVRAYVTYAEQQTVVYGIDGGIGILVVPEPMNVSELREIGIKALLLEDRMFATLSAYRQTRRDFYADTSQVPATLSRGLELEVRWLAGERLTLSAGANWQESRYVPERPATVMVAPSAFGFDNDYFGGRLQAVLPPGSYDERSGYPDMTMNLNGTYFLTDAFSMSLAMTYQGEVASGRLGNVTLPAAYVAGASLMYDTRRLRVRISIENLTNELYFTPNSPDVTGELIVIPAPERRFVSSVSIKF